MKKNIFMVHLFILGLLLTPEFGFGFDFGALSIHGFVSQGYLKSNDNNYLAETADGTFEFNEAAINFSISPVENLRVGLQLLSRDLGKSTDNSTSLDWGYADYRFNDAFGIRVGKVKGPMGLYNQTRDVDFLRTFVFLPQGVYNEASRDQENAYQGGGAYGNFDVGNAGNFEYELVLGTVNANADAPVFISAFAALDPLRSGNTGSNRYVDMKWAFIQALRWNTPLDGLRFGITNLVAKVDFGTTYDVYGTSVPAVEEIKINNTMVGSVEYVRDRLTLAAEYKWQNMDVDIIYAGVSAAQVEIERIAYYGSISYQFLDWLELGTYYSVSYPDKNDKGGHTLPAGMEYFAWQKDWAVAAKFNFTDYMTLKLEAHAIDGAASIYQHENPGGIKDDMILFATKCSVNF